jgi:hypothetical protein
MMKALERLLISLVLPIPNISRNECMTPLMYDIFQKAYLAASSSIFRYVNADIILMSGFMESVGRKGN